ncbi:MAG: hypothetical protein LQ350_000304 [Teloschistes chrysophthalmus]|nr:MAG: hypothetical protein LQ350_000304 [Niorma chrysophthalma]
MSDQAHNYPSPDSAHKGMSTPYQPAPAAGAQAQHHDDDHHHQPAATTTTTSTAQPHQQPTAGPAAASSPSPAAGPALVGDPLELDPQLMDSQQRWARENGVLIVQRPTTATSRTDLDALRAERPQLRWEHKGMDVFFGYPRVAGEVMVEKVETVEEMESQFDREFVAIMKGRQG